jgi:hypothetical protein
MLAGKQKPKAKDPARGKKKAPGKVTAALLKEIERSLLTLNFYPVAVKEEAKNDAMKKLKDVYSKNGDTVRQHMLFLIHENVAQVSELKQMTTYDAVRAKSTKASPGAARMAVYKSIFNYTTSNEGLSELVRLLGDFKGDDSAKLLTHLFSHFCSTDSETHRMLRSAAIEALGESDSPYALKALLEYAKLTDNDKLFGRLVSALTVWGEKVDGLQLSDEDKQKLKEELQTLMAKEEKPTQYG